MNADRSELNPRVLALGATIVVLVTLAVFIWKPWTHPSYDWVLDQYGRQVDVDAETAFLGFAQGTWIRFNEHSMLATPQRTTAIACLLGERSPTTPPPSMRGDGPIELWWPQGKVGPFAGNTLLFSSRSESPLHVEVRQLFSQETVWERELPAVPSRVRTIQPHVYPQEAAYEIIFTMAGPSLQQQRFLYSASGHNEGASSPIEALYASQIDEQAVAQICTRLLLHRRDYHRYLILGLLPHADRSPVARQVLSAIAKAYSYPQLATHVEGLDRPTR